MVPAARCAVKRMGAARAALKIATLARLKGIGRDGRGWIRAQLVQMAWRWLRYQPDSALAQWFEKRTPGAPGNETLGSNNP